MCQSKYCWLGWVATIFLVAACTVPRQDLSKYKSEFSDQRVFSETPASSPNQEIHANLDNGSSMVLEGDSVEPLDHQSLSAPAITKESPLSQKDITKDDLESSVSSLSPPASDQAPVDTPIRDSEYTVKEDTPFTEDESLNQPSRWKQPFSVEQNEISSQSEKTDHSYKRETTSAVSDHDSPEQVTYDIPIVFNKRVKQVLNYYLKKRKKSVEVGIRRSGKYLPLIKRILKEEGVPLDLAYLVATESNYDHRAYSPAGAAGLWQFIPATGRTYGLKKNRWVDERLDIVKSTHAAARLLKHLYETFNSWELALAAYNAGEGRVRKGIRIAKAKKRPVSYWTLNLPKETKRYVADFMAITIISKNLKKYGFDHIEKLPPLSGEKIELSTNFSLQEVAKRSNQPFEKLLLLNGFLIKAVPPLNQRKYSIYLPTVESEQRLLVSLAKNPNPYIQWKERVVLADKSPYITRLLKKHGAPVYFRVRKGDNLWKLAKRYNTTVTRLRWWNKIGSNNLIRINQRLKFYLPTGKVYSMLASDRALVASNTRNSKRTITVRPGDTLSLLARKYRVSVKQLQTWNKLAAPEALKAYQKLIVFPPSV